MLVECPKRGDGQDWDGSHLLELLRKCDILIAYRGSRCASVKEVDGALLVRPIRCLRLAGPVALKAP